MPPAMPRQRRFRKQMYIIIKLLTRLIISALINLTPAKNAGLFITTSDPNAQYGADVGTVDFNGAVNIETSTASALFIDGTKVFDGTLNFNNDLTLKAAAGQYAIYIQDNRGTNASCTLNINPNENSTVRITGDIYPEISQGGTDRVVNLKSHLMSNPIGLGTLMMSILLRKN